VDGLPPKVRVGGRDDWAAVARLLRENRLPTDGLTTDVDHLYVLEDAGTIVGAIAFESYVPDALLRSLVVDPKVRGAGHGRSLLRLALHEAQKSGIRSVYGLTTTIAELLAKLGFTEIQKADIPRPVHHSWELRGSCLDSARAFRFELGS
jgi:N-acetylglutamate synthase-like GNAT family acetyltransferase